MAGRFSIEAIFKLTDRMSRPVVKIQKRVARMTRSARIGLRKMDRAFSKVGKTIKRTGLVVAAGAGAAALALRNVAGTGAEFEQAITNVGAVSLKSRDEIAALEEEALKLGRSTKFTATEVAGAMEIMAKAGFSTEEILSGVSGVLDAAAASGLEIAEVADVVSGALKGMGLATTEATRVADVLALASSKTNSTIGTLGESIKNVAATAKKLKVPFEDVVASVALLQDVGLDASVAGSAMNTMLTKLAKPPAAVAKQMKKFGISFKDAKGDMLPFQKVIGNISEAAKRSGGNLDQVAFLADLVGLRGQKAASNLADLFESGKLQTLTEELQSAEGAAAKMAELRMDTFQGDVLKLEAAVSDLKIGLFDLQGGPLRGVVQGMTEWIELNREVILSKLGDFMQGLVDNFDLIVMWMKRIGVALAVFFTLQAAIKVATAAMAIFNAVMALNPFVALAIAVIAAGALIAFFWDDIVQAGADAFVVMDGILDGAKAAFMAVGEFIVGVFALAMPGVTALVAASVRAVVENWSSIKDFFVGLWTDIVDLQRGFVSLLMDAFSPIVDFYARIWTAIADSFKSTLGFVFDTLAKAIGGVRSLGRSVLGGDDAPEGGGAAPGVSPQVVSPQQRVSREILESRIESRDQLDVNISDETGRAQVTRQPNRATVNMTPNMTPSGGP